ncbi:MAG TPA: hypothetical protein V6C58_06550 [Allocoleopsis sp.]
MPSINTVINVDDRNLRRRIKRIEQSIDKNGKATTNQVARLLMVRAARLAPKRSNKLAQFIKTVPTKSSEGIIEYTVGYENNGMGTGNPHPEKTFKGGQEFSLPRWMEPANMVSKTKARTHPWNTGIRPFLAIAANITKEEFRSRVKKMVRNALQVKIK